MIVRRAVRIAGGFVIVFLLMLILQHDMHVSLLEGAAARTSQVSKARTTGRSLAVLTVGAEHDEEWLKLRTDTLKRLNEHVQGELARECRFQRDCDPMIEWMIAHRDDRRIMTKLYVKIGKLLGYVNRKTSGLPKSRHWQ